MSSTLYATNYDHVVYPGGGVGWITSDIVDLEGRSANDTIALFTLPVGATVLSGNVSVHEIAGEACTLDIGIDGGTADGFIDGADVNVAAGSVAWGATGAYIVTTQTVFTGAASTRIVELLVKTVDSGTLAAGKVTVNLLVAVP